MSSNNRSGISPIGLFGLLLTIGSLGLFMAGNASVGPGSAEKNAPYSSTCIGAIGKWIKCSGTVVSNIASADGRALIVELYDGSQVSLVVRVDEELDGGGNLKIGRSIRFAVKYNQTSYYKGDDNLGMISATHEIELYCTRHSWSKSGLESMAFGLRQANMDVSKHPGLAQDGTKLIQISGMEVVGVEPYMGNDCPRGKDLSKK